ncbi:MAG: hypothetical protein EA357_03015 [Micavibrio sp.]|nr:MAG: hypothetical protein EA357_03015 [Micavibrio sp.]
MLPFSHESLIALYADYNAAFWPLHLLVLAAALYALYLALRPAKNSGKNSGRIICAVLGAFWLWTGVAFHFYYFEEINFLASLFAALFVTQALFLFLYYGPGRDAPEFRLKADVSGYAAAVFALLALVIYPVADYAAGDAAGQIRIAGMTPAPTVILTVAFFLMMRGKLPFLLALPPALWLAVEMGTALALEISADLYLAAAGLIGLLLVFVKTPEKPVSETKTDAEKTAETDEKPENIKKPPAKKAAAKKAPAKKPAAKKKPPAKKASAKKTPAKKASTKKKKTD